MSKETAGEVFSGSAERRYKDSVFRMLFGEREALLHLYNALCGTDYRDPGELEINTLENAIYMGRKNDLSFVIHHQLYLYEHQSTVNPNMPLRDLFYIAALYTKLAVDENLYSRKRVRLPRPGFIVFYNGEEEQPESQVLRLSEAYEGTESEVCGESGLELTVQMLNINRGKNRKLMESCRELREYAEYVETVRKYRKQMELREAVENAVRECLERGILESFLRRSRAEVTAMTIFEYDEEEYRRMLAKEEREEGRSEGRIEGCREAILTVLSCRGEVSGGLREKIGTEPRPEVLERWLRAAAECGSVQEFAQRLRQEEGQTGPSGGGRVTPPEK